MSEEQAPTEDTPDVTAAPQGTPAEQVTEQQADPFEKRYEDLVPAFTRASQEAAQYRDLIAGLQSDDPDTRAQAAQAIGWEVPVEPEDDFDDDPTGALQSRLDKLEQQLQGKHAEEQEAQRLAYVDQVVEQQLNSLEGLDETDHHWIVSRAIALPPTDDGLPDIKGAYDEMVAWEQSRQKKWAQTKRTAHISPVGTSGTSQPDLDDPEQRIAWMVQAAQERSE